MFTNVISNYKEKCFNFQTFDKVQEIRKKGEMLKNIIKSKYENQDTKWEYLIDSLMNIQEIVLVIEAVWPRLTNKNAVHRFIPFPNMSHTIHICDELCSKIYDSIMTGKNYKFCQEIVSKYETKILAKKSFISKALNQVIPNGMHQESQYFDVMQEYVNLKYYYSCFNRNNKMYDSIKIEVAAEIIAIELIIVYYTYYVG